MAELKDLPFSIEAPGDMGGDSRMSNDGPVGGKIPGYLEPHQRCGLCEYFDESGGAGMCKKFKQACDPDGGCPSFEESGMEEDDGGYEREDEGEDD